MSYLETKDLLQRTLPVTPQVHVTKTKYPCTGFCYLAIRHRDVLCELYRAQCGEEYHEFIKDLIREAGERKEMDPQIDARGEYINADTVIRDFGEITGVTQFSECAVESEETLEIVINDLSLKLLEVQIGSWILVNRSQEAFVIFKLDNDVYLVVDSHQTVHGTVDFMRLCQYITRNGQLRGSVQLGVASV